MRTAFTVFLSSLFVLALSQSAGAQAPIAGQPYQVPSGYEAYGPDTLISYGGYNYVIQGNGTMLLGVNSQPSDGGTVVNDVSDAGQPYQIPSGYEGYGPGTLISYGGYDYVVQGNGTMLLSVNSQPSDGGTAGDHVSDAGQPYQIPSGYEGYGPGTPISYGGYDYVVQGNGTMLLSTYQQPHYTPHAQTSQQLYSQPAHQRPQQMYQQPQYTHPAQTYQPQYTPHAQTSQQLYSQPAHQQPQQMYQQPQYTHPAQTYQPQYTHHPAQNYQQPSRLPMTNQPQFRRPYAHGRFSG